MNFNDIVAVIDKSGREYVKIETKDGTVLWELAGGDDSDYLVLTIKTTTNDEEVALCYSREGMDYFKHFAEAVEELVIDGEVYEMEPYHIFSTPGEHEVKYKFRNNEVPSTLSSDAYGMFYSNTKIIKAVVGNNITSLGKYLFYNCTKLNSIIVGDGVKAIPTNMCESCLSLASVTIGSKVMTISSYAFYRCSVLKSLTMKYDGVTVVGSSTSFSNVPTSMNVYVPTEQVEKYKIDTYWKTRASYIQPIM